MKTEKKVGKMFTLNSQAIQKLTIIANKFGITRSAIIESLIFEFERLVQKGKIISVEKGSSLIVKRKE